MSRSRIAPFLACLVFCTAGGFSQERPRWETLNELARAQSLAGNLAQAEQTYKTALGELQAADPPLGLHVVAGNLAHLYRLQNRLDEAEALYRGVLASQERRFGVSHRYVAHSLFELGKILAERGNEAEAEQLGLRALAIYEVQPPPNNRNAQSVLQFLIRLYQAQGREQEAAGASRRVLEAAQERVRDAVIRFGEEHPAVAGTITELAQAYSDGGQYDQAEVEMLRALKIYESSIEAHPELSIPYSGALQRMAQLYSVLGRDEASRQLLARAENLRAGALHYERDSADR